MIGQGVALAMLFVACPAWLAFQSVGQPSLGNQNTSAPPQKGASPRFVRKNVDEDSIRARLLASEAVQKDLALTREQIEAINKCAKTTRRQYQEFLRESRKILVPGRLFTKEESDKRLGEHRTLLEAYKSKEKQARTKILAILTPGQSERLKQLQFQFTAVPTLARPEIVKALDISSEQSENIRVLAERREKEISARFPARAGLSPKEYRQKSIEFLKESHKASADTTKEVLEILTPEQRARFETMLGKKIEITWDYDSLILEDSEF
jgi:Spy/CpxP family protein refolding chaperone